MEARRIANDRAAELSDLRHDVVTKCMNIKTAVIELRGTATADELELVALMSDQARELAERIDAYAAARGLRAKK